jgi:hypothetical protein
MMKKESGLIKPAPCPPVGALRFIRLLFFSLSFSNVILPIKKCLFQQQAFFFLCTKQQCYYLASVATHSCTVGNSIQQKTKHFTVSNGEERKVKPI